MRPARRWLLRPWVLYTALGIAAVIVLAILYGWLWIIRDAELFISEEGIGVYDARSKIKASSQNSVGAAKQLGQEVDMVYRFLRLCIPLRKEDEAEMKEVSVVFVDQSSLRVIAMLSTAPYAAAIYTPMLSRIYITESGDMAHEWIHHYLNKRRIAHRHHSETPQLEHPLFARCEQYFIGPSFGI